MPHASRGAVLPVGDHWPDPAHAGWMAHVWTGERPVSRLFLDGMFVALYDHRLGWFVRGPGDDMQLVEDRWMTEVGH